MRKTSLSRTTFALAAAALLAVSWLAVAPSRASEEAVVIPPPAADVAGADGQKTIVLAGGCFWGVQGVYQHTKGVSQAVSGYAGGLERTANYETVGRGTTGHAEAVKITYDPKQVSLGKLLQIYFSVVHDPTQLDRQGPDVGTQYRSVIFTHGPEQARIAAEKKAAVEASGKWKTPVVTQIEPAPTFWKAEESHERYFQKHGGHCHVSYAEVAES